MNCRFLHFSSASIFKVFQCCSKLVKYFLVSNSLDPDETPRNSASHPDPNCLTLSQYSKKNEQVREVFWNEADES